MIMRRLITVVNLLCFGCCANQNVRLKYPCDRAEIILTSSYMKFDNRLESEIGLSEHPRMLVVENGTAVVVSPLIILDEMGVELNFTTQQKSFLQSLYAFYPESMKVTVSYSCELVAFRCFISCNIGHEIVMQKKEWLAYSSNVNRSAIAMCEKGYGMDILKNSSRDITSRWSDLCKTFSSVSFETDIYTVEDEIGDLDIIDTASRISVGFRMVIISLTAFVTLVIIFTVQRRWDVRT